MKLLLPLALGIASALAAPAAVVRAEEAEAARDVGRSYRLEWDDSGLLLTGKKIVRERPDAEPARESDSEPEPEQPKPSGFKGGLRRFLKRRLGSRSEASSMSMDADADNDASGTRAGSGSGSDSKSSKKDKKNPFEKKRGDCEWAKNQIEEAIGEWKMGQGVRYLKMFHEDARVNMLAGHLEDGHDIQGRDHLYRCMAGMGGDYREYERERELLFYFESGNPSSSLIMTKFEDTDYAYLKSTDADGEDFCIVYLSIEVEFTNGESEESVHTEGLVRYDVMHDGQVASKLSLNVDRGGSDCNVDRAVGPDGVRG